MSEDFVFVVETSAGRTLATVSRSILQGLAGRSHVTAQEVFDIHRLDLEEIIRLKVRHGATASPVRIESFDV